MKAFIVKSDDGERIRLMSEKREEYAETEKEIEMLLLLGEKMLKRGFKVQWHEINEILEIWI